MDARTAGRRMTELQNLTSRPVAVTFTATAMVDVPYVRMEEVGALPRRTAPFHGRAARDGDGRQPGARDVPRGAPGRRLALD
jgi:hypothetical protein